MKQNTINIFDGTLNTSELKGTFAFEFNGGLKEDTTQKVVSSIKIIDAEDLVRPQDTFFLKIGGRKIVGIIQTVGFDGIKKELSLLFGVNSYANFVNMPENKLEGFSLEINNANNLTLKADSDDLVITTDTDLTTDVLLRQAIRKSPKKISMDFSIDENKKLQGLEVNVTDYTQDKYFMRLSELPNVDEQYADDTFNAVVLKDQSDSTNYKICYWAEDGTATEDIKLSRKPITFKNDILRVETANISLDYAESVFKQQEYDNEIDFTVPLENSYIPLKYDDAFLGRRVTIYSKKQNKEIDTIISAYEIINNTIKVTLGLSRTKIFTKKTNKRKEMI